MQCRRACRARNIDKLLQHGRLNPFNEPHMKSSSELPGSALSKLFSDFVLPTLANMFMLLWKAYKFFLLSSRNSSPPPMAQSKPIKPTRMSYTDIRFGHCFLARAFSQPQKFVMEPKTKVLRAMHLPKFRNPSVRHLHRG